MKLKSLSAAIALAIVPTTSVFAAALDRSGQSIAAFLQPGNYAEIGISSLHPTVDGKDASGNQVNDMADTYNFWNAALKVQPTEYFSFGLLYDEPFGAAATYKGNNNFVAQPNQAFATGTFGANAPLNSSLGISGSTHVDVDTRNITSLFGFKPMTNFTLYGGLVYQEVEGKVNLRGASYGPLSGYDINIDEDSAFGWIAGAAYEIPEIALKTSITYRSEIEHEVSSRENLPLGNAARGIVSGINSQLSANPASAAFVGSTSAQTISNLGNALTTIQSQLDQVNTGLNNISNALQNPALPAGQRDILLAQQTALQGNQTALAGAQTSLATARAGLTALAGPASLPSTADTRTKVTTPQSVNLDFQTGIMADTVAFANVRWVDWKEFSVQPPLFGTATSGLNLVDYTDDQWSANVGVGRKLSDVLAGNVSIGWDSGAGNPVTTLGPTEGYWNVGLGLRYSPAPQVELSGGVKYFWLGDADAKISSGAIVGDFEGNHALAVGLKLGYRF